MQGGMGEQGMYRSIRIGQRRSSAAIVIALVAGFFIVSVAWFICKSGFWDAKNIDIQGLRSLDRGEVNREIDRYFNERTKWRPWKASNLLFLDTQKMQDALKERLFAENVTVDKSYPNVLRLLITERQRSVVLVSGEQYISVDMTGVVTGDAAGDVLASARDRVEARAFADQIHLPVIVMQTADPLTAGFQVATPDQVRRWIEASRELVMNGVSVRFMKIEKPDSALGRFVSARGYDIYVDITQPIAPQIQTYQAYMRSKPDEGQIREHLDIRVPGRVYIK